MKALVIKQTGDHDIFSEEQRPMPTLKPGHMVIAVKGSSVNPLDVMLRSSDTPWSENLPEILHGDVAGIVTAVADDVEGFSVGDEVYGCAGGIAGIDGALAEFMLVDADLMAIKPKCLSMKEAAALPLVAITAWEALHDKLATGTDQHVLIHGAAGGVGHVAIQLAKAMGAKVTATATTRTFEVAQSLGADHLVNVNEESVSDYVNRLTDGSGFDAVFDTVAGDNIQKSFEAVKFNGAVATILPVDDVLQVALKGLSFHSVLMLIPMTQGLNRKAHGDILRQIAALVDQGAIRPLLDDSDFSLWQASDAHARFESGKAIGKIALSL